MKRISRADARALGLLRYFTGEACSKGHVAERSTSNHRCVTCRKNDAVAWRKAHPEKTNADGRARWQRLRAQCVEALGGACECCSEDELAFLAIDHRHGGGNAHRRSIGIPSGSGGKMHVWILRQIEKIGLEAVKQDFRILCFNCNQAIASRGVCPHQEVR